MSTLVIVGTGGTGGHVFPAQALCEYIVQEKNVDLGNSKLKCGDFTKVDSKNIDLAGVVLENDDMHVHFVLDKKGYEFLKGFIKGDLNSSKGLSGYGNSDDVSCDVNLKNKVNVRSNVISKSEVSYEIVRSCGIKKGILNFVKFGFMMCWGTMQSVFSILKILRNYNKIYKKNYDEVFCIGFGGYSSFPPVIACKLLSFLKIIKCKSGGKNGGIDKGAKIFLHQSDVVMGKANRFLCRFANKVFLGLVREPVSGVMNGQGADKFLHVGIPVRNMFERYSDESSQKEILKCCRENDYDDGFDKECVNRSDYMEIGEVSNLKNSDFLRLFKALNNSHVLSDRKDCEEVCNWTNQKLNINKLKSINILAMGGSQSAAMWSDVLPRVVELLPKEMKGIVKVTQQCGKMKVREVRRKYIDAGLKAENVEVLDFIEDIASKMNETHVVFARSGASTIAECAFMNKPAVFVPYKFAAQNHQMKNAEVVQKYCGGWIWSESWSDSASATVEKMDREFENTEKEIKILSLVNFLICLAKILSDGRSVSVNLNEVLPRDAARKIMNYMRNC